MLRESFRQTIFLCDLHGPWDRAVMFWHLFSVLKITVLRAGVGWSSPTELPPAQRNHPPTSHRAPRVSRQHPQSVVLEGSLFSRNKPPSLFFASQRAAAELNAKLLLLFAAARCEQLKTVQVLYLEPGIFQGLAVKELQASASSHSSLPFCVCLEEGTGHVYHSRLLSLST